jgi:hypothetical protein
MISLKTAWIDDSALAQSMSDNLTEQEVQENLRRIEIRRKIMDPATTDPRMVRVREKVKTYFSC